MVDASALVAFFLREEGWRGLARYLVRTVSVDHVVKEFYNAVWKAVAVQGRMSWDDANAVLELFKSYLAKNMEVRDEMSYVDRALEIARETRITVYDALYVALAVDEGLPLLTLDEQQRRAAEGLGVRVLP